MAYEATKWTTGDVITADKLNKLEIGVKNEQVGPAGEKGATGQAGPAGAAGKSAYQIWLDAGNEGTEAEFLGALKGAKGESGPAGKDGIDGSDGAVGKDGKSAYEIAVNNGYEGTESEWLANLKGVAGKDGAVISTIALTVDDAGKITGGTATLSDESTAAIKVTTATA